MQQVLRRGSPTRGPVVGTFYAASIPFSLRREKGRWVGLIDGYKAVESISPSGHREVAAALAVVASRVASAATEKVLASPTWWNCTSPCISLLLERTMVVLSESVGDGAVDAQSEQAPVRPTVSRRRGVKIQPEILSRNLSRYGTRVDAAMKASVRALERTRVLLGRKLPDSMWGATELQRRVDEVLVTVPELQSRLEAMGREAVLCRRTADSLSVRAAAGFTHSIQASPESTRHTNRVLIPDILAYHSRLSSFFGEVLAATSLVLNLERVVHRLTGYPASFFFNSAIQEDYGEAATTLLKFMADIPSMGRAVFEPLESIQQET